MTCGRWATGSSTIAWVSTWTTRHREGDAFVIFEDNLTAYNEIGIEMLPWVTRNVYTNNIFQENREQVAIAGGGELRGNDWARDGWGNYWNGCPASTPTATRWATCPTAPPACTKT